MSDSPFAVHILLASEQAAPNLLAALDPGMKPARAELLVTTKMQQRAADLKSVLGEAGVSCVLTVLDNEHDVERLQTQLLELAARLDSEFAESVSRVAINLTGGNKLMALVALDVARTAGWAAFYVDVDTDQVIWVGQKKPAQSLTQQLRLRHYLKGYGYQVEGEFERPQPQRAWGELTKDLILNGQSFESALGQLNYLAQSAEKTLTARLTGRQQEQAGLAALLLKFEQAGLLDVGADLVTFKGEDARFFVNGGWLEYHVYQTLAEVTGRLGIRDKAMNVRVKGSSGQPNEVDAMFLCRNRLFMIECKTARMDDPDNPKANDALYKLAENCRRIGGLGTRGMFCTYRRLRDSEKRLANALNLEVVSGADLRRLGERLHQWVNR